MKNPTKALARVAARWRTKRTRRRTAKAGRAVTVTLRQAARITAWGREAHQARTAGAQAERMLLEQLREDARARMGQASAAAHAHADLLAARWHRDALASAAAGMRTERALGPPPSGRAGVYNEMERTLHRTIPGVLASHARGRMQSAGKPEAADTLWRCTAHAYWVCLGPERAADHLLRMCVITSSLGVGAILSSLSAQHGLWTLVATTLSFAVVVTATILGPAATVTAILASGWTSLAFAHAAPASAGIGALALGTIARIVSERTANRRALLSAIKSEETQSG